jgi:hypothetical protein
MSDEMIIDGGTIVIVGAVLGVLITLAAVVNSDYEEELMQAEMYCDMVKEKVWPDYDHNIKCEE